MFRVVTGACGCFTVASASGVRFPFGFAEKFGIERGPFFFIAAPGRMWMTANGRDVGDAADDDSHGGRSRNATGRRFRMGVGSPNAVGLPPRALELTSRLDDSHEVRAIALRILADGRLRGAKHIIQ